jgi:hypothetical protein
MAALLLFTILFGIVGVVVLLLIVIDRTSLKRNDTARVRPGLCRCANRGLYPQTSRCTYVEPTVKIDTPYPGNPLRGIVGTRGGRSRADGIS